MEMDGDGNGDGAGSKERGMHLQKGWQFFVGWGSGEDLGGFIGDGRWKGFIRMEVWKRGSEVPNCMDGFESWKVAEDLGLLLVFGALSCMEGFENVHFHRMFSGKDLHLFENVSKEAMHPKHEGQNCDQILALFCVEALKVVSWCSGKECLLQLGGDCK